MYTLGGCTIIDIMSDTLSAPIQDKRHRLEFAKALIESGDLSQHFISQITGVSRDTLRKYINKKVVEV
jgi:predicted transcriptional regulator